VAPHARHVPAHGATVRARPIPASFWAVAGVSPSPTRVITMQKRFHLHISGDPVDAPPPTEWVAGDRPGTGAPEWIAACQAPHPRYRYRPPSWPARTPAGQDRKCYGKPSPCDEMRGYNRRHLAGMPVRSQSPRRVPGLLSAGHRPPSLRGLPHACPAAGPLQRFPVAAGYRLSHIRTQSRLKVRENSARPYTSTGGRATVAFPRHGLAAVAREWPAATDRRAYEDPSHFSAGGAETPHVRSRARRPRAPSPGCGR
jgi:hypothetical protein